MATEVELRMAKALDAFFASDGYWSIYDMDGTREWFEQIGYKPSEESISVESDDWLKP